MYYNQVGQVTRKEVAVAEARKVQEQILSMRQGQKSPVEVLEELECILNIPPEYRPQMLAFLTGLKTGWSNNVRAAVEEVVACAGAIENS